VASCPLRSITGASQLQTDATAKCLPYYGSLARPGSQPKGREPPRVPLAGILPSALFDWALPLLGPQAPSDSGARYWSLVALREGLLAMEVEVVKQWAATLLDTCERLLDAEDTPAHLLMPCLAVVVQVGIPLPSPLRHPSPRRTPPPLSATPCVAWDLQVWPLHPVCVCLPAWHTSLVSQGHVGLPTGPYPYYGGATRTLLEIGLWRCG